MGLWLKRIVFTVLTIIIMLMSFSFSSQSAPSSGKLSKGIIARGVELSAFDDVSYHIKADIIKGGDNLVRKAAHFTEYAMLSVSVYFMLLSWSKIRDKKLYFFTVLICFAYALTDEVHQLFSAGRAMRFFDIFIDTTGAVFACVIIALIKLLIDKYINRKEFIKS